MIIEFSCYCKIYDDKFPNKHMYNSLVSETDIVDFLLSDAECNYDYNGEKLFGNHNIWYLATCDDFGYININKKSPSLSWRAGGSSWTYIKDMILDFSEAGMNPINTKRLNKVIIEGMRAFDSMYNIKDYLISKKNNEVWIHPEILNIKEKLSMFIEFKENWKRDGDVTSHLIPILDIKDIVLNPEKDPNSTAKEADSKEVQVVTSTKTYSYSTIDYDEASAIFQKLKNIVIPEE